MAICSATTYVNDWPAIHCDSPSFQFSQTFYYFPNERSCWFYALHRMNSINIDKLSHLWINDMKIRYSRIDWFFSIFMLFSSDRFRIARVSEQLIILNFQHNVNCSIYLNQFVWMRAQGEQVDSTRPVIWNNWSLDELKRWLTLCVQFFFFPVDTWKAISLFVMPPLCRVVVDQGAQYRLNACVSRAPEPELFLHDFFLRTFQLEYISLLIQFYPDIVNKCAMNASRLCVFEFRGKQWYRKAKKWWKKEKRFTASTLYMFIVEIVACAWCLYLCGGLMGIEYALQYLRLRTYVIHYMERRETNYTAYELWVLSVVSSVCERNELRTQRSRTRSTHTTWIVRALAELCVISHIPQTRFARMNGIAVCRWYAFHWTLWFGLEWLQSINYEPPSDRQPQHHIIT